MQGLQQFEIWSTAKKLGRLHATAHPTQKKRERLPEEAPTCMLAMTAGMPSASCVTSGRTRVARRVGRYAVRSPVLSVDTAAAAALTRVRSSPSRRRCLPALLFWPSQAGNLQPALNVVRIP